jgi:hypothetical protein
MLNQKPCPVAPGQGSENDQQLDDGSISTQIATPQRVLQGLLSSAIAVSNGRAIIGAFATRRAPFHAVNAAGGECIGHGEAPHV